MLTRTYIDVRIEFDENEDLVRFLKIGNSTWCSDEQAFSLSGIEWAVKYFLDLVRECDGEEYCGMDSGCISVTSIPTIKNCNRGEYCWHQHEEGNENI